jgi:Raf kinase inhibitor-like YbhB/YbcL family protein
MITPTPSPAESFQITTDAIDPSTRIFDVRYTCDSDNSSPEIRWNDPPEGTTSFALVMDDPDAPGGTFIHWVVYDIPLAVRHLPAGIPSQEVLPNGIRQGLNTARKLGYFGPCPPQGDAPHGYRLTLYALNQRVEPEPRLTGEQLRDRIRNAVIAQIETMGRYGRARKAG